MGTKAGAKLKFNKKSPYPKIRALALANNQFDYQSITEKVLLNMAP